MGAYKIRFHGHPQFSRFQLDNSRGFRNLSRNRIEEYPYQLSFAPIIIAIAPGNTIVLKPSGLHANTAAIISKIIKENFDQLFPPRLRAR